MHSWMQYQGANTMLNGVGESLGNANNIGVPCSATSAAGLPWAMPVTQSCMAFLYWTATPQLVAFLSWAEKRASSACLSADATLAGSAFLSWAETPRALALLEGLDREILPCRV